MQNLEIQHVILAVLGMAIHVMMKIIERKEKINNPFSFRVFFSDSMNWVRMGLAITSTIALLIMADDVADWFGIKLSDGQTAKGILAFTAGYLNHSLIRNVLKVFNTKIK